MQLALVTLDPPAAAPVTAIAVAPPAVTSVLAPQTLPLPSVDQIADARALLARMGDPTPNTANSPVYHFAAGSHPVFYAKKAHKKSNII